eukprot:Skav209422  [mRNA]  locus=scaffold5378:9926:18505:+ [translate_table: standard]
MTSEESLDVSIQTMKHWDSHADVLDSYEEYKHCASRVKALQEQMGRQATPPEAVSKKSSLRSSSAMDDDEDDEPEVVVVKARSLRESTRLQSKRILPLGDSDDEDLGNPNLKVVETGVVTNEGIDTSPSAQHRGQLRNRQD